MTDSVKEALRDIKRVYANWIQGVEDCLMVNSFNTIIKMLEDAPEIEQLHARIAELEKDRPEVVTVKKVIAYLEGCSANTDTDYRWRAATILREGIKIVQDKEGVS